MQLLQSAMPIWLLLKLDSSWSLKTSLTLHLAMVVAVVTSMPLPFHSCPNWWIMSATLCSLFELFTNDPNLLFTLHNQTYVVLVMKLCWCLVDGLCCKVGSLNTFCCYVPSDMHVSRFFISYFGWMLIFVVCWKILSLRILVVTRLLTCHFFICYFGWMNVNIYLCFAILHLIYFWLHEF